MANKTAFCKAQFKDNSARLLALKFCPQSLKSLRESGPAMRATPKLWRPENERQKRKVGCSSIQIWGMHKRSTESDFIMDGIINEQ